MPNRRAMPEDFPEVALQSSVLLRARYGCGTSCIMRWRKALNIDRAVLTASRPARTWLLREIPEGFGTAQAGKGTRELGKIYSASTTTIRKWLKQLGIARTREKAAPVAKPTPRPGSALTKLRPQQRVINHREDSLAGQASRHMQADGWISYRCTETGAQDAKGTHYRLGRLVVTPDELIERAQRKGFKVWSVAA